jgi:hypothetical protein
MQAIVLGLVLFSSWGVLLLVLVLTHGTARLEDLRAVELWIRIAALTALSAMIALWFAFCRQRAVDRLRPGAPEPMWRHNRRLLEVDEDQRRPVTVYSGFRPFVGGGLGLLTWSFAQILTPEGGRSLDEEGLEFITADLVDHVKEHIGER